MSNFNDLSNNKKAKYYKENYNEWKKKSLDEIGFFLIFESFYNKNILSKISGNGLKLYIFLGIHSKNFTGESWVSIESISKYFNKTPRAVSYWIRELEDLGLIKRMQLEVDKSSHTFLQPY